MSSLKTVGVKELKNNLSAYLREVRRGARVFVADRQQVVAELREPGIVPEAALDPTVAAWVEAGEVRLPTAPKAPLPESPVSRPDGTAQRWLDASREERP
jgi:antitoxin (DNA-binding transcriptional repressor) of toxin-antitoxin stability system